MTSTFVSPEVSSQEREELDWLLTSGALGRSSNVAKVLRYICEETSAGRGELLKEYSIAVEALGRRPDFDPQNDTIVRVTVHTLRKRLQDIYEKEGMQRPLRVVIPPGRYAAQFLPRPTAALAPPPKTVMAETALPEPPAAPPETPNANAAEPPTPNAWGGIGWVAAGLLLLAATLWLWHTERARPHASLAAADAAGPIPPAGMILALMGSGRHEYQDHSGWVWKTTPYCHGGSSVPTHNEKVGGTEDPYLYLGGLRGIVHCVFPVKPGMYEVHFHFAELSDLEAAQHPASISINAGQDTAVDVVDEAGGDQIATVKVATGVTPESDGAIHLDYTSEVSPLNAVEILPAPSARLLPVRLVAASSPWKDPDGQLWLSDRYFSGGRRGLRPNATSSENLGLYGSDRIGRFHYSIPVVAMKHYRVRLYFREPWFGRTDGTPNGDGGRIFDVACNGTVLLKDFDILSEGGSAPLIKTFDHVQATPRGTLELDFMPVKNYPLVNALEVVQED